MDIRKVIVAGGLIYTYCAILAGQAKCISLSGPITASTVTVTGDLSISSTTISSMTITNLLNATNTVQNIKGLVLQTKYSSTTVNSMTTSTTLTAIPGMSVSIALRNPSNYVRISVTGMLATSDYTAPANLSIERDSSDLGGGAFITTYGYPSIVSTGITVTDSPGDTNSHTYSATFNISTGTETANFTVNPVGYLLVQEISR